jgi:hypothetical protein
MSSNQPDEAAAPEPQYEKSIEFLEKVRPGGEWCLVAIDPNKKGLEADTFGGTDVKSKRLIEWLEEQGSKRKRNIYWTVNQLRRHLKTKPSREHISGLNWLHVDVDPRAGEDIAAERERIRALLLDPTHLGIPKPTCVVFSGGGYQAFWRLRSPMLLDGSAERYEDAKLWNKQLELTLGGDNCHNVDRLMRLPGTINRPDARKRAKGRVEELAREVEFNDGLHDLDGFEKAEPERARASASSSNGAAAPAVTFDAESVTRFSSVDDIEELRDKRWNQCRVVIVQGSDPDDPDFGKAKKEGRSGPLFFVCCEMVRAGCSDEAIYAVITDPGFGISASVLDKGSGIERYALRQIQRAREEAIDPLLRELNDKHSVIGSIGGKCRITTWDPSPLKREVLHLHTAADFSLRYRNRKREWSDDDGKRQSMPAAVWWLEHALRREFRGIVFDPSVNHDEVDGCLNLWRGFGVAPRQGDYPLFRELVHDVIAAGDPAVADYLWKWTAWLVQNPDQPAEVAIVLRGGQGTGKGTWARALGRLFGQHFAHVSDSRAVAGRFNAHMRDCVLLFADEAVLGDVGKDAIGTLKRIITEPTLFIEGKGVDAVAWLNRLHVVMASNERWVVPAGIDERRFVVTDVSSGRKDDHEFWTALGAEIDGDGLPALLHEMLAMDLGGWHPRRDRPVTAALTDQKARSVEGLDAAWFEFLQSGELPGFCAERDDGSVWLPSSSFLDYLNLTRRPREPFGSNLLRNLLAGPQENHRGAGMGFEKVRRDARAQKGPQGYVIPPLPEARRRWDDRRFPYTWDDDGDSARWIVFYDPDAGVIG